MLFQSFYLVFLSVSHCQNIAPCNSILDWWILKKWSLTWLTDSVSSSDPPDLKIFFKNYTTFWAHETITFSLILAKLFFLVNNHMINKTPVESAPAKFKTQAQNNIQNLKKRWLIDGGLYIKMFMYVWFLYQLL